MLALTIGFIGPIAQLVRAEDLKAGNLKLWQWLAAYGLHVSKFTLLACRTTQIRGSLCESVVIPSQAKQRCLEGVETVRVGRKDKRQSRPQTGNGQRKL